jgi:hypothetical protein
MPVIPALWRLRQEDREFKVSLGYIKEFHFILSDHRAQLFVKKSKTLIYI